MKGAATSGGARQIERQTVKPSKGLLKTAQEFKTKNWDRFRGQLNKALAKDPEFLKTTLATQENLRELKAGRNPHAPKDQAVGKRTKMEWDHLRERREGVNPTDARNLALKTPLAHTKKIAYKFNKDGGGIPASQSALFVKTGATKAPKQAVKPTATPAKDVSKTPMSYFKKPKAF